MPARAADSAVRPNSAVLKDWVRALDLTQRLRETQGATLPALVLAAADGRSEVAALIGTGEQLSYGDLAARANRYARWALAEGLAQGEVVGLLMPNCPDYIAIWFGLTQVGCVVALLNTHLPADALVHCIRSAAACHVIVAASLLDAAGDTMAQLPATRWWAHGAAPTLPRIDLAVATHDGGALHEPERRTPALHDPALLIYTSGTTGLPKAAFVSHGRVLEWGGWFAGMLDAQPDDRLYDCLPLYHSTGGVVAIGAMLLSGGSVVIRERFSASRFWSDVTETGCSIVQYIGELCRYLLQSGPDPQETAHRVRLCCGNGLRGDVWVPFQQRFGIPRILEFYAATEGSVSLYNCEAKPGAIGRVPAFLAHRFGVALIRCDPGSGEPLRDTAGRCIRSDPGEPGEAIGQIGAASRHFEGYTDPAASARKVLHDVFAEGDAWFRTGDLMRKDVAGYYYFVDRLGDTFRWKGENVATTEVATVLERCHGVIEAVVYGVTIPGTEGKAGMAALVVAPGFRLPALRDHCEASLPSYGRPLFVRLCPAIEATGTFKLSKTTLAREGYAASPDPVWFDDKATGRFVPLDAALRQAIEAGEFQV